MKRFARHVVRMALLLAIHADALRLEPLAYIGAARWWVLRKRVRARGQFAPLLSLSPRAYMLWGLKIKPATVAETRTRAHPIFALVDGDGSTPRDLSETLASLEAAGVPYTVVSSSSENQRLLALDAVPWSSSPWLMPARAGDRVAKGAVGAYLDAICADNDVIYADDELLNRWALRTAPHLKPNWNAELFQHHDYLTGACIVRGKRESLAAALQEPDWGAALVTRALAERGRAKHIHEVLHSRQFRPKPLMQLPPVPKMRDLPRLSAIIPTRNRVDLLSTCIAGLDAADYHEIEAIVVDNDSDDPETLEYLAALPSRNRPGRIMRVLRHPGLFNYSTINNRAVAEATGELVCLLNNDIEMLAPDWLAIMATQALREEVGAVGAQLLYPDGKLQHAGVVIGVGNAAGHAHRFLRPEEEGYFYRHALPQFVSAVTAACLVVRRERFLAVGGLDESAFPVAFNDVDLCLKLNVRGWQSFYEPRAVLVHHESVSRGIDQDPVGAARFAGELAALQRRWNTDTIYDPFHHPQLSRASEQFALSL
jgi:GT2 family glycosyltransferase